MQVTVHGVAKSGARLSDFTLEVQTIGKGEDLRDKWHEIKTTFKTKVLKRGLNISLKTKLIPPK